MVESSIALSVLTVLIFGAIEMSQMGMTSQVIATAASAGCRMAVINGRSQSDVTKAVASVLNSSGIKSSAYTLTTSPSDVTTSHMGDSVSVTVSVAFKNVSWFGSPFYLKTTTLSSSATMSSERP